MGIFALSKGIYNAILCKVFINVCVIRHIMTKHFKSIMANKAKNADAFTKSKEDLKGLLVYSKKHAAMHRNEQSNIYQLRKKKVFLPESKF